MGKYLANYTKKQLLEKAAAYWKNCDKILASSDGQFFYIHAETYCDSYVKDNKLKKYFLTKEEYQELKNEKKVKTQKPIEKKEEYIEKEVIEKAEKIKKSQQKKVKK